MVVTPATRPSTPPPETPLNRPMPPKAAAVARAVVEGERRRPVSHAVGVWEKARAVLGLGLEWRVWVVGFGVGGWVGGWDDSLTSASDKEGPAAAAAGRGSGHTHRMAQHHDLNTNDEDEKGRAAHAGHGQLNAAWMSDRRRRKEGLVCVCVGGLFEGG